MRRIKKKNTEKGNGHATVKKPGGKKVRRGLTKITIKKERQSCRERETLFSGTEGGESEKGWDD
jgi:hypothetical protein